MKKKKKKKKKISTDLIDRMITLLNWCFAWWYMYDSECSKILTFTIRVFTFVDFFPETKSKTNVQTDKGGKMDKNRTNKTKIGQ